MGRYERAIKIAFDMVSGEILEADEVFDKKKDAFEVRRQFHKDEVKLYCCECQQKLNVSTSKYDRLHFKHQQGAEFCILKDSDLSPAQLDEIVQILKTKESTRHKYLKNEIAKRIAVVEGVDISSIAIDNRFIIRGSEKRRPDVYCRFHDKEIVFEIQLSQLSLRYIIDRHDFYKKHGIYLVWILDNFDLHKQSQLERDIKYLTTYQNFFKLDEGVSEFKLLCEYKSPYLSYDNEVHSKWITKSVFLPELQFDANARQVFYFNFGEKHKEREGEKKIRDQELAALEWTREQNEREQEIKRAAAARLAEIKEKTGEVRNEIRRLRKMHSQVYTSAISMLRELDEEELGYLNSFLKLNSLDSEGNPVFFSFLMSAKQEDVAFIEFLMTCQYVEFDVNAKSSSNLSAFRVILENRNIGSYVPIRSLFSRGYVFTPEDEIYIRSIREGYELEADILIYRICSTLNNRHHVSIVFEQAKLVCILNSAKEKRIIGFRYKPNEWIAFANNAAEYYGTHWEYIEAVFKHFGLWDVIIELDKKKGTFQNKVSHLYSNMPKQEYSFDRIFQSLFPELRQPERSPFDF